MLGLVGREPGASLPIWPQVLMPWRRAILSAPVVDSWLRTIQNVSGDGSGDTLSRSRVPGSWRPAVESGSAIAYLPFRPASGPSAWGPGCVVRHDAGKNQWRVSCVSTTCHGHVGHSLNVRKNLYGLRGKARAMSLTTESVLRRGGRCFTARAPFGLYSDPTSGVSPPVHAAVPPIPLTGLPVSCPALTFASAAGEQTAQPSAPKQGRI